jgi:hypothetical protein
MEQTREQKTNQPNLSRKWLLLSGFVLAVTTAWAALELTAASDHRLNGYALKVAFFGVLLLNVVSLLARWLLTKSRQRIFLLGRLPFTMGMIKLAAFATVLMLIITLIGGIIAGPHYRAITLSAFVLGLVWSAILMLGANGILTTIIVVRYLRGTLASTSREPQR